MLTCWIGTNSGIRSFIAVEEAKKNGQIIDKVLIWKQYPLKLSSPTPIVNGRDCYVNGLLRNYRGKRVQSILFKEKLFLKASLNFRSVYLKSLST
jgi:hypothetical protein